MGRYYYPHVKEKRGSGKFRNHPQSNQLGDHQTWIQTQPDPVIIFFFSKCTLAPGKVIWMIGLNK